jgi:hypothetical protein
MLEVMQIEGARFKKYVLQNSITGIIVQNKRFWTIRGARRRANKNIRALNKTIRNIDKTYRKV